MADMSTLLQSTCKQYIVDSNEALEMRLVREPSEIYSEVGSFNPEMSHQVFGDGESIFGYKGLQIKLYYSACRLTTYLAFDYEELVDSSVAEGIQPDEVLAPIAEKIPPNFLTNLDDFTSSLEKEANFRPFGESLLRFSIKGHDGERTFEIFAHDIHPSGFADYHERLQTFLLWYIDASSYIDVDDERWRFFLVYERYFLNGSLHYAIAGYMTVYQYYAYPDHIRPRISQMLILPPFQRMSLGGYLLQAIYDYYTRQQNVLDITVEDPAESFQKLRDFVDCKNCLKLKSFNVDNLKEPYCKEMENEARSTLKLNKMQSRRVYEILRLAVTNRHDCDQYKSYRLNVKNRLNVQFKKEDNYVKKLNSALSATEAAAAIGLTSKEQRIEILDNLYKEIEEQYDTVVDKLMNEGLIP